MLDAELGEYVYIFAGAGWNFIDCTARRGILDTPQYVLRICQRLVGILKAVPHEKARSFHSANCSIPSGFGMGKPIPSVSAGNCLPVP